jgi:predicted acyl esterase
LNGELQRKFALGSEVDRLAAQNGFAQATIAKLAVDNLGGLAVQVRFWRSKDSAKGLMLRMVDVSPDGTESKLADPLLSSAVNNQQFLGVSEDGKNVMLERAGKKAFVNKQ